jgi:ferredoxin-NADP reductase
VLHRAHSVDGLALGRELTGVPTLRYVPLPGRRTEIGWDPLAPEHLARLVPDVAERDTFICGPESLIAAVERSARAVGVPRGAIHHEELSLS